MGVNFIFKYIGGIFWDLVALSKTFPLLSKCCKSGLIRVSLPNVQKKSRRKMVILYRYMCREKKSGI